MSRAPTMQAPRANFDRSHSGHTTIDFDYIYPIYFDEVNPGETFNMDMTLAGRLATPLHPLMSDMYLDTHFFFIPMRQLWDNSRKFFGEQIDPGDSIDYTIPKIAATATTGYGELSLPDYLTLPTKIPDYEWNALYARAYVHCYNEWFRDQNLIDTVTMSTADGPDTTTDLTIQKRGKRHDYFTSGLVAPQKNGDSTSSVSLPLGTRAPITGLGKANQTFSDTNFSAYETQVNSSQTYAKSSELDSSTANEVFRIEEDPTKPGFPGIYADLTNATAATILQLREAEGIQRLLELDARAGTRYSEIVYSVFGTQFQDVTYRPEFLGGGSTPIEISQVPQTSNDGTNGDVGALGAFGTVISRNNGFTKSFTEHGVLLGMVSARASIDYAQGLNRMFDRTTRYDYLYPVLQNIGDQATLTKEIYCQDPATDTGSTGTPDNERTFNYQERYAELKYKPSWVTGLFRPNATASLESWILTQEFTSLPTFDQTFIESDTPIIRAIATPAEPHLILDVHCNLQCARPMHMYSIPGMGARF